MLFISVYGTFLMINAISGVVELGEYAPLPSSIVLLYMFVEG